MSANKIEITLPSLNWFMPDPDDLSGYIAYTGSVGTSPSKGFMNREIFEYKAEKMENTKILLVTCRTRNPWTAPVSFGKSEQKAFELSEEGLRLARMWIEVLAQDILLRKWD